MKSYELKPTKENLLQTFQEDTIGRNASLFQFVEILNTRDNSCSISLDGAWGSGKTFFVKQLKLILDAHNQYAISEEIKDDAEAIKALWKKSHNKDAELKAHVCVYYDAWENDNDDDPVLSLVYSIMKSVNVDFSLKSDDTCLKTAASLLEAFTGKPWRSIIDAFGGEDPLSELQSAKDIEVLVKEFLDDLLAERGDRLVVFVDELDRCKPSYAVKLLERIKHYFENERITFVFSTNLSELQHSIKKCYGNDFNAYKYLDRFFDLRVTLPPANLHKYYESLSFIEEYSFDVVCSAIIEMYGFQLRDISKYLRLTRIIKGEHDCYTSRRRLYGLASQFALIYIVPIALGLKISDSKRYENFVSGRDVSPLIELSGCLEKEFFSLLCEPDETYNKMYADQKEVRIDDKLKMAYEAIFVKNYTAQDYQTKMGECRFDKSTKDIVLNAISLLSPNADYSL